MRDIHDGGWIWDTTGTLDMKQGTPLSTRNLYTVAFACCIPDIGVWYWHSHCQVMDPGHFR